MRNLGVTFNMSKKAKEALREVVARHIYRPDCQMSTESSSSELLSPQPGNSSLKRGGSTTEHLVENVEL